MIIEYIDYLQKNWETIRLVIIGICLLIIAICWLYILLSDRGDKK